MALRHSTRRRRGRSARRCIRFVALAALGLAAVSVCVAPPTALAGAVTESLPAEDVIGISENEAACLGEGVTFTGSLHLTTVTTRSSEKLLFALHHVVGTGVETGARYSIVGTQQLFFGDGEFVRATFNVVGGRHRVFEFVLINAQGHVVDRGFICR